VSSSLTPALKQTCDACSRDLPAGVFACPECHALVYSAELQELSAKAKELEAKNQFRAARDEWIRALALLPHDSDQAEWIRNHARQLLERALDADLPPAQDSAWAKRLGPLGPIAVFILKGKSFFLAIFKFKFLLTLLSFLWIDWAMFGIRFGTGFTVLILIHELGHYIDIKRRGLPAEMPVFLPGFGAYVRWQAMGVSLATRAAVSLAGPLAGWLASFACVYLWWHTGDLLYAALARASAMLNILNWIPVWFLDGGQAATALNRSNRIWLLAACCALWALFSEPMFFLVALGVIWRLFTKDAAPQSSLRTLGYYVAVLALLGVVLLKIPGEGFLVHVPK